MIRIEPPYDKALEGKTFIDLFAGIGAFRLALTGFGARCVFSSEWDEKAQETYRMNYGDTPAGDITKTDERDIPPHDILCAGFPCQPFSISGRRLGFADTRGTLFFDVARIVKHHRPEIVLLENVRNFASHDGGRTLRVVTDTLEGLGYDVRHAVLDAADYGVPQKRERIYFVCFRKDLGISGFGFPEPVPLERHVRDILESGEHVKDFIVRRTDVVMNEGAADRLSASPVRLGTVARGRQGERIYGVKGTAVTLSAYGGGIGAKTGLYLTEDGIRRLTPRECARLDGFPDTFLIPENRNTAYRQFGNSIVVDVLQYIVMEIVRRTAYTETARRAV